MNPPRWQGVTAKSWLTRPLWFRRFTPTQAEGAPLSAKSTCSASKVSESGTAQLGTLPAIVALPDASGQVKPAKVQRDEEVVMWIPEASVHPQAAQLCPSLHQVTYRSPPGTAGVTQSPGTPASLLCPPEPPTPPLAGAPPGQAEQAGAHVTLPKEGSGSAQSPVGSPAMKIPTPGNSQVQAAQLRASLHQFQTIVCAATAASGYCGSGTTQAASGVPPAPAPAAPPVPRPPAATQPPPPVPVVRSWPVLFSPPKHAGKSTDTNNNDLLRINIRR